MSFAGSIPAEFLHEGRDLLPLRLRITLGTRGLLLEALDAVVLVHGAVLWLQEGGLVVGQGAPGFGVK